MLYHFIIFFIALFTTSTLWTAQTNEERPQTQAVKAMIPPLAIQSILRPSMFAPLNSSSTSSTSYYSSSARTTSSLLSLPSIISSHGNLTEQEEYALDSNNNIPKEKTKQSSHPNFFLDLHKIKEAWPDNNNNNDDDKRCPPHTPRPHSADTVIKSGSQDISTPSIRNKKYNTYPNTPAYTSRELLVASHARRGSQSCSQLPNIKPKSASKQKKKKSCTIL
jgi:hypothetical protein